MMPPRPTTENEIASLSGAEKAAVVLLSTPQDAAAVILKQLSEREIEKLTNYAARLGNVPSNLILEVKQEFCDQLEHGDPLALGQSKSQMKELLTRVLPADRLEEILEFMDSNVEGAEGLEGLKWLDPQVIGGFLRNEHPQTIALVMAYLEPRQAAQVLAQIPQRLQPDVIYRLSNLERISPAIVRDLNEVIKAELLASDATKSSYVGGVEAAAEIMNHLEKTIEENVFTKLEESDPPLAEHIRELMFVFEDLTGLDDRAMQQILREVSNDQLILALKTASEGIKDKIFKNISSRAADMIREELTVMGPVRLSDVETAQQEIVKTARRLESEGKVALGASGGETFV
ncbi:MAG: flagellar motor switch protein FliG [Candidatus Sumerlaeota bacterium]|nr:flagellar motor switch protein FliG [Candidatus Sumerlaeota bacterium]